MGGANLVYGWESGYLLTLIGEKNPTDEEFAEYSAFVREKVSAGQGKWSLILTEGGIPTARQRAVAVKTMEGLQVPTTAIVTTSVVMRGVATALSWMRSDATIKLFHPSDLEEAMAFLQVPPHLHTVLRAALKKLAHEMGREHRALTG